METFTSVMICLWLASLTTLFLTLAIGFAALMYKTLKS
jgi:hypothetical protein